MFCEKRFFVKKFVKKILVRIILSKNAGKQTFVKKRKHFGENKNLLKQNLRVKQNFWSKKLLVKKNVWSKKF